MPVGKLKETIYAYTHTYIYIYIASLKAPRSFFPLSQVPYNATSAESQGSRQSLPSNCHHLCPCLSRSIQVYPGLSMSLFFMYVSIMLNHACSSVWHACRLDLPTSQLACQNCSTGFARQIKAGDEAGFVVSGSSVIWTLSGEWAWICYGKPTRVNKRYVVIDVCWVWLNAVFTIMLLVHTYVILVLVQSRKWTMEVYGSAGEWWGYELISFDFCLASRPNQKQLRDFRSLCAFPWKGQFNCGTFPCFVLSWILLQSWSAHVNKTADKTIDSMDDTVSWLGHQLALFSLVSCFHHFCSIYCLLALGLRLTVFIHVHSSGSARWAFVPQWG